jgi:hypothetical protein
LQLQGSAIMGRTKFATRGVLPGRIRTEGAGAWLIGLGNLSLVVLFVTYLALRPAAPERSAMLQRAHAVGGADAAAAANLDKMRVSSGTILAHVKSSSSKVAASTRSAKKPAKATLKQIADEGVKAGAAMWEDMQKVAAKRPVMQLARGVKNQLHLQSLACGECAYKDNPLSEIDEPNVFPGPSEFGPDSPTAMGPLGNALNSACCGGTGENAFGAPALSVADMRKVYEIGEPNFKEWKEFEKENNIFPGIVDWDPDSPKGYNPPFETKELFDGHGGIVGLEDSDGWEVTPQSAAHRDYGMYADESSEGMDRNVYANGYVFPDY